MAEILGSRVVSRWRDNYRRDRRRPSKTWWWKDVLGAQWEPMWHQVGSLPWPWPRRLGLAVGPFNSTLLW
jgi:hypothetical protein